MPLAAYKSKRERVTFGGGKDEFFDVRGISLPDVAMIIELHAGAVSSIVEMAQGQAEAFNSQNPQEVSDAITNLIVSITRESPILVANLIAICADEEDAMTVALTLPVTVQLDAMTKIAALTFRDLASVKKLAADVMRLIRGIVPSANPRRMKK